MPSRLVVGWACATAAAYYYAQQKHQPPSGFSASFSPEQVATMRRAIAEAEEQAQQQ